MPSSSNFLQRLSSPSSPGPMQQTSIAPCRTMSKVCHTFKSSRRTESKSSKTSRILKAYRGQWTRQKTAAATAACLGHAPACLCLREERIAIGCPSVNEADIGEDTTGIWTLLHDNGDGMYGLACLLCPVILGFVLRVLLAPMALLGCLPYYKPMAIFEAATTLQTRSLSNTVIMSRQTNQNGGQKADAFSEGYENHPLH